MDASQCPRVRDLRSLRWLPCLLGCALISLPGIAAEPKLDADRNATYVYRAGTDPALALDVYVPQFSSEAKRPALVFFHGGSWRRGSRTQFKRQARRITARAPVVVISVDYPLNGNPIESTQAAQGAVCWVRAHADQLRLDPKRIAVSGGSAGGQLATAVALMPRAIAPECALLSPPYADALALFNPVLDLSGPWELKLKRDLRDVSPVHLATRPLPPTIIFQGSADTTTPLTIAQEFVDKAKNAGSAIVRLETYPGRVHSFYNQPKDLRSTVDETLVFLKSLGWY